jgi:acyl-CoA synthetase (NDP forming)
VSRRAIRRRYGRDGGEVLEVNSDSSSTDAERDLGPLLSPRSIVIIGASLRPGHPSLRVARNLDLLGFSGDVVGVGSPEAVVGGVPALRTILGLRSPCDVAVVAVRATAVVDALAQAADVGIRHFVILSGGFGETGESGTALQAQVTALAKSRDLVIVGPNSMGNVDFVGRSTTSFTTLLEGDIAAAGPVALVSQSGGLAASIYSMGVREGLRFSRLISTGNEAQVDVVDCLKFFETDNATRTVCVVLENVRRGYELLAACARLRELGKEIVLLKTGRGRAGSQAAASHTGVILADSALSGDLLMTSGTAVVRTPREAIAAIRFAASDQNQPTGSRVAIVSNSGGTAVLSADLAEEAGLDVVPLDSRTQADLASVLPPFAAVANPIDLTAEVADQAPIFASVFDALVRDTAVDVIVVVGALPTQRSQDMAHCLAATLPKTRKPCVVTWIAPDDRIARTLADAEIQYFNDPSLAFLAIRNAIRDPIDHASTAAPSVSKLLKSRRTIDLGAAGTSLVLEFALKQELAAIGLGVPRGYLSEDLSDCARRALALGFPVALKALSPNFPHKAAVGAMRLGINSETELRVAWSDIQAIVEEHPASGASTSFLVEEMLRPEAEIFVGFAIDKTFGPVCVLGPGGTNVETKSGRTFAQVPMTQRSAERAIARLGKRWPCLSDAASSSLARELVILASWWLERRPVLWELDLNPVAWTGKQLVVLDALGTVVFDDRLSELAHEAARTDPP